MAIIGEIIAVIIGCIVALIAIYLEYFHPFRDKNQQGVDGMVEKIVAKCPHCHEEGEHNFLQSWQMKNARMKTPITITVYRCMNCDKVWRKGIREDK